MLTFEDQMRIAAKSRAALDRIKSAKDAKIQEQNNKGWKKPNYARVLIEEYSEDSFKEKIRADAAYYNVLLKRLDDSKCGEVQESLAVLGSTVRQIYEQINLKPKIYGLHRLPKLDETDNTIEENATRIISDFITRNYYSLSKEDRTKTYGPAVKAVASKFMINENMDGETAVRLSTKVVVVKQLLESINFPLVIRGEIDNFLLSEEYEEMFETDKLRTLWESFENQIEDLAKVVASVV